MSDLPFADDKPISYEIWIEAVEHHERADKAMKAAEKQLTELMTGLDAMTVGTRVVMRDPARTGGFVILKLAPQEEE